MAEPVLSLGPASAHLMQNWNNGNGRKKYEVVVLHFFLPFP